MTNQTARRLFGAGDAFAHPVVRWVAIATVGIIVAAAIIVEGLRRAGRLDDKTYRELKARIASWAVLAPLMIGPVLLGAAWFMAAVGLLAILCYREFARATGLFRNRLVSVVVALGIAGVTFAAFDHWYGLFVALTPLTLCILASLAILEDRPQGYVQRVALAAFAFLMIGVGLGHLAYFGNDANYRAIVAWLLVGVEMNDVFAYLCGKTIGRRKLIVHTSPNKTVGGALGAMVLTTALMAMLGHRVFYGQPIDRPVHLIILGIIISIGGQFGDLMLSSIKRDLGIKDMGTLIPGHGGLLDRFDSLLLVAPAVFHYVGYFQGVGLDQATRIFSSGW
jgi:phosphatidate cytidylyltransferase